MLELPLDEDLLKVLSSDSRREILRLLAERRMTGSELAHRLGLGKPAVAEHLKRLTETELILRIDDPERKWVYYELSHRGRSLLEPQRVRFYLVLGIAVLAMGLGVAITFGLQAVLEDIGDPGPAAQAPGDTGLAGSASEDAAGMGPMLPGLDAPAPEPQPAPRVTLKIPAPADGGAGSALDYAHEGVSFEVQLADLSDADAVLADSVVLLFRPDQVDATNGTVVVQALALPAANATLPAPAPAPTAAVVLPEPGAPAGPNVATAAPGPNATLEPPAPEPVRKLVCTPVALPAAPLPTPSPTPIPSPSALPAATPAAPAPLPGTPPAAAVPTPSPSVPAPSPSPSPTPAPATKLVVVCNLVEEPPAPAPAAGINATAPEPAPTSLAIGAPTPTSTPTLAIPSPSPTPTPSPTPAEIPGPAAPAAPAPAISPAFSEPEAEADLGDGDGSALPAPSPTPVAPETDVASLAIPAPSQTPTPLPPPPAPLAADGGQQNSAEGSAGTHDPSAIGGGAPATTGAGDGASLRQPLIAFAAIVVAAAVMARAGPGSRK